MIRQGSNKPIVMTFSVAPLDLSVTLHNEIETLKHWAMADLIGSDYGLTYTAPITQEESMQWEEGPCEIEIRWSNVDGIVKKRVIRETIEHTTDTSVLAVEFYEEYYEEEGEGIDPLY